MFLESLLGSRPQLSVETWELGARLFLGITGIGKIKLTLEGELATELLLVCPHVNLKDDTTSLPNPEITGAANLIQSRSFDAGNCVVGLHGIQELRGCINHWGYDGRIWIWLIHPINQLLAFADPTCLWVRCNDQAKWQAFWNAIQFMRDVVDDVRNWPELFPGAFSETIGIDHEATMPSIDRQIVWFSGDATLRKIG